MLFSLALAPVLAACGGSQASSTSTTPAASNQACVVGDYEGSGTDDAGTQWTVTFDVREVGPDLVGTYHWVGSDGSVGDEHFRGHADCAARTLDWSGSSASGGSATMDVVPGHYTGTITDSGLEASWSGGEGIPGRFTAHRR